MPIVIKKRVSLDFLGDEYKDAYLTFKAIPLKDYEGILDQMPKKEDTKEAMKLIVSCLKKYFHSGKFPDEENKLQNVTVEEVDDFDGETALTCFQTLMGQRIDPKLEGQLTEPSTTDSQPQEN